MHGIYNANTIQTHCKYNANTLQTQWREGGDPQVRPRRLICGAQRKVVASEKSVFEQYNAHCGMIIQNHRRKQKKNTLYNDIQICTELKEEENTGGAAEGVIPGSGLPRLIIYRAAV